MAIVFLHPGRDGKTMSCHYCHEQFELLFACSECDQPVCVHCGLLEQPGKPYLVPIIVDMDAPPAPDDPMAIGIERWLDTDDPQERFLCSACLPEEEPTLVDCPYCGGMHESHLVESCPIKPT
jgi:uncharacterized Zn-finger protein